MLSRKRAAEIRVWELQESLQEINTRMINHTKAKLAERRRFEEAWNRQSFRWRASVAGREFHANWMNVDSEIAAQLHQLEAEIDEKKYQVEEALHELRKYGGWNSRYA
ncbi:unnamed protein product [Clonostachys solani]|uniref:Uncharacterized protein n=1 Tax=Clonostachys solani TaxID=160281 RepID=A0A9P0EPN1_9HYPO|nr:unnamed protein product [Clonostachys solani]